MVIFLEACIYKRDNNIYVQIFLREENAFTDSKYHPLELS